MINLDLKYRGKKSSKKTRAVKFMQPMTDDKIWTKERRENNKNESRESINRITLKYGSGSIRGSVERPNTKVEYHIVPKL